MCVVKANAPEHSAVRHQRKISASLLQHLHTPQVELCLCAILSVCVFTCMPIRREKKKQRNYKERGSESVSFILSSPFLHKPACVWQALPASVWLSASAPDSNTVFQRKGLMRYEFQHRHIKFIWQTPAACNSVPRVWKLIFCHVCEKTKQKTT